MFFTNFTFFASCFLSEFNLLQNSKKNVKQIQFFFKKRLIVLRNCLQKKKNNYLCRDISVQFCNIVYKSFCFQSRVWFNKMSLLRSFLVVFFWTKMCFIFYQKSFCFFCFFFFQNTCSN